MIIDGRSIANSIKDELRDYLSTLASRKPCLAVVLVGHDHASEVYVNSKAKACAAVGIRSLKKRFDADVAEEELLNCIHSLNEDASVDGILVQLPLPKHIDANKITLAIHPAKDVDGFHPVNLGRLIMGGTGGFVPCTPLGIRVLLEKCGIEVQGKHAVIIGRSTIVGKPLALLLTQKGLYGDATVTVAHSRTKNLKEIARQGDILIACVGQPHLVTADMVKEGAVVIDVGVNRIDDPSKSKGYRLVGDVDFKGVKDKCSWITPVPGGVGPMTIAMLLSNTVSSFKRRTTAAGKK